MKSKTRKGKRRITPIEQAATYALSTADHFGAEPVQLSPTMLRRRELGAAWAAANAFETWLRNLCFRHNIATEAEQVALVMTLLVAFVEAELVDRAMHPHAFRRDEPRPNDDHVEADRLTIVEPQEDEEQRPPEIHPGCQGRDENGFRCIFLRSYGYRFCRRCEALYLRDQHSK